MVHIVLGDAWRGSIATKTWKDARRDILRHTLPRSIGIWDNKTHPVDEDVSLQVPPSQPTICADECDLVPCEAQATGTHFRWLPGVTTS